MQVTVGDDALIARQRRERSFYDEYVRRHSGGVSFQSVTASRRRPWNPYWTIYDFTRHWLVKPDMRLLDFGCGPGADTLRFAKQGYLASGFDISIGNIATAQSLAAKYRQTDRVGFSVQAAERLAYADNLFDVVTGIDILHHVHVERAMTECLRVLKPGGRGIFLEPVEAPLFDRLRRSSLAVMLFPMTPSLDRHVTEDERKLTRSDLATIHRMTANVEMDRFLLLARLDRYHNLARWTKWSVLERADGMLLTLFPPLGAFGGKILVRFQKPDSPGSGSRSD